MKRQKKCNIMGRISSRKWRRNLWPWGMFLVWSACWGQIWRQISIISMLMDMLRATQGSQSSLLPDSTTISTWMKKSSPA